MCIRRWMRIAFWRHHVWDGGNLGIQWGKCQSFQHTTIISSAITWFIGVLKSDYKKLFYFKISVNIMFQLRVTVNNITVQQWYFRIDNFKCVNIGLNHRCRISWINKYMPDFVFYSKSIRLDYINKRDVNIF